MLINALRQVIDQNRHQPFLYQRNLLKEAIQAYILNFVYTSAYADRFLFKGGTCLRFCFDLPRLSEDLDFDVVDLADDDCQNLVDDLAVYVHKKLQYDQMTSTIKGRNNIIYLQFPVLAERGLSPNSTRSSDQVLHVRIDLAPIRGRGFTQEVSLQSTPDFAFLIRRYSLADLFAGKVATVLTRETLEAGVTEPRFKGRDFFDIWWLQSKGVEWNEKYLESLIGQTSPREIRSALNAKIEQAAQKQQFIKQDLLPFFSQPQFVTDFVTHLDQLRF